MIDIQHVLCPVDRSEPSKRALDYAFAIARWYGAHVTVLYVFPNMPVMDVPPLTLGDAGLARLREELQQFVGTAPPGVRMELLVTEAAEVDREIVRRATALPADLVVMGSHGRSGFRHFVLGSVTERTLREIRRPVLVVPHKAGGPAPGTQAGFHNIICAVDFSPGSEAAVRAALGLAKEADAHLVLLHVIEIPPEIRLHSGRDPIDVDTVRLAEEARCLRALREMVPEEARTYCDVETCVREGAADFAILTLAEARGADLVVVGVQGRGALDRLVFGSTSARVTRAAHCPVLVVHPGDTLPATP